MAMSLVNFRESTPALVFCSPELLQNGLHEGLDGLEEYDNHGDIVDLRNARR